MSDSSVGWVERSSDSVQPVHSCPCSQMTGGLAGVIAASAMRTPAADERPIVAATPAQNFSSWRREKPPRIGSSGLGPRLAG